MRFWISMTEFFITHEPFHEKNKERKDINRLINGSVAFLSNVKFFWHKYANDHCLWTLWTLPICWLYFFFFYWFFSFCLQSNQVIQRIIFSKKLIKNALIWLIMYFSLFTNYSNYFAFGEILALRTFQKQPFRSVL